MFRSWVRERHSFVNRSPTATVLSVVIELLLNVYCPLSLFWVDLRTSDQSYERSIRFSRENTAILSDVFK